MTHEALIAIWYAALSAEFGVALSVPKADIHNIQCRLYEARKTLADPELDRIMLCLPGDVEEIWLCKKEVELDP